MTSPIGMHSASLVTPEATSSSPPSPEAMLDKVVMEVVGATKFSKVKAILEENEIETLVELAMYSCDELLDLLGSVSNPLVSGSFETVSLTKTQAKKLSLLKQWYMSQPDPSSTTWLRFTKDDLDAFIMGSQSSSGYNTSSPVGTPSSPDQKHYTEINALAQSSLVADFNKSIKSIKRSVGDYPQLKDDKLFASWDRTLQAVATAQDVHQVLNCTYIPVTLQEQQLFTAKSAFMYSVFVTTLNTAKSRKHVRKYQSERTTWMLRACMHH